MKILVFGANSTIAKELQKIWAGQGHSMVLVGRDSEKLSRVGQDLKVRGATLVETVEKDLLDFSDADKFIEALWENYDGFDLVFMAQGILGDQREDEKSAEKSLRILESNFISHAAFLTPLANLFEKAGQGTLAVITSVAGDRGKQSNYIYCAAKAGKIAFLSGLRNRLYSKGVHVIDLRLGFVDTAMTAQFKKGALWAKPESVAKAIHSSIENKEDVVYLPKIWFFIMMIIRNIPEVLFKRLKL